MPYRKKRKWKAFVKKIDFIAEKRLGTHTQVFNKQITLQNLIDGGQGYGSFGLYTMKSASVSQLNDMTAIKELHEADPTILDAGDLANAGVTGNFNKTGKFLFQSGIMDMTVRNTSGDSATGALNSELTLEVDLYEVSVGKRMDATEDIHRQYNGIGPLLNAGFDDTLTPGTQGTSMNIQDRGVSPWDTPEALSRFGIKILKKTKYFLPNNGYFTYQIRDPGRHVMSKNTINEWSGPNKPGLTKWIFLIFKTLPGVVNSANVSQELSVGLTRKYSYKLTGEISKRENISVNT